MAKFILLNGDYIVRELVDAEVAAGFFHAPRPDIQVGDSLTEDEKVQLGLVLPVEPEEPVSLTAK